MSRQDDEALVRHINHLQSIARTAADSEIVSYRRRARTQKEIEDMALDPTRELPEQVWAEVRDPAGNEAMVLAALLRNFPTPDSMRGGGQR